MPKIRNTSRPSNWLDRVIDRRSWEQSHETRIDLRWDLGLDVSALLRYQSGEFLTFWEAYRAVFHRALGITPEKFAEQLEARRRYQCGALFDDVWPAAASGEKKVLAPVVELMPVAIPKKPCASEQEIHPGHAA